MNKEILKSAITNYLDCTCQFFEPTSDDKEINHLYEISRKDQLENAHTPVLLCIKKAQDLELWYDDSDFVWDEDEYKESVRNAVKARDDLLHQKYRLNTEIKKQLNDRYHDNLTKQMEYEHNTKKLPHTFVYDSFISYWNPRIREEYITYPIVLAAIPTAKPYEIFAWIQFTKADSMPEQAEIMGMAKYFYEEYHMEPAIVSFDTFEFILTRALTQEEADQLAKDLCAWNMDVLDFYRTEENLVNSIMKDKKVWVWWD